MREPARVTADVCVVGAGPAGLTVAAQLAGRGVSCLLLEQGPDSDPGPPDTSGTVRGLPYPLEASRAKGVGGTARAWFVRSPEGHERVRLRAMDPRHVDGRDWVDAPAWPVPSTELAPWLIHARRVLSMPEAAPDIVDDPVERATGQRVRAVAFETIPRATFVADLPAALRASRHVKIMPDTTVVGFDLNDDATRVTKVSARRNDGSLLEVDAETFVLAAGAVENARLLMDPVPGSPVRLGDAGGRLGVGFMEHPHFYAGFLRPEPGGVLEGFSPWVHHPAGFLERRYVLAPDLERSHGLLAQVVGLEPLPLDDAMISAVYGRGTSPSVATLRAYMRAARGQGDLPSGASFRGGIFDAPSLPKHALHLLRRRLDLLGPLPGQVFRLEAFSEQLPRASSRVVLVRSASGRSGARVRLRLTQADVRSMGTWLGVFSDELQRAGVGTVRALLRNGRSPDPLIWGHHHMGTTVMADSPDRGVVDADGRVHGCDNLYVVGSSVFPTSGYANPTLTLVALAARLGTHLASR